MKILLSALMLAAGLVNAASAQTGVIAGVVVNERHEPVPRAVVQAFLAKETTALLSNAEVVPFSTRSSGSATTDSAGRFQISTLELGAEYLIAAEAPSSLASDVDRQAGVYATTFSPSTADYRTAQHVSAALPQATSIEIALVRVNGVHIGGSVVSLSGRSLNGFEVRLFRRFGSFGSESRVAMVSASGQFEIFGISPGWYRLTVASPARPADTNPFESATQLIEVRDENIEKLSLTTTEGALISGRVVPEGIGMQSGVGMRVTASPAVQYGPPGSIFATVASDFSFHMSVPSGPYQLTAGSDRASALKVTRIELDGHESPASAPVVFVDGSHSVALFVAPRPAAASAVNTPASSSALVDQFTNEKIFWRQLEIAKALTARRDNNVLAALEPWLTHEDRHIRGNVAFVFAALGDPRGFSTIAGILGDRGDRPQGQGIGVAPSDGRYHVEAQIAADRYYAAHLLGDLRDPRGIGLLTPLLNDPEVKSIVPWALEQIGDTQAVKPLLEALDQDDPSLRVLCIYALEALNAKEAVPRLVQLLNDHRRSNFGAGVSVAEAAQSAIAKLHSKP